VSENIDSQIKMNGENCCGRVDNGIDYTDYSGSDSPVEQSITMDQEVSSDSLTHILNELDIRFPEDYQSSMDIGTDNLITLNPPEVSPIDSSTVNVYEEPYRYSSNANPETLTNHLLEKQLVLPERSSHPTGTSSLDAQSFNMNNSGPYVLVPLSMLNLPFSTNQEGCQFSILGSQSRFMPSSSFSSPSTSLSSDTEVIHTTDSSKMDVGRNATNRENNTQKMSYTQDSGQKPSSSKIVKGGREKMRRFAGGNRTAYGNTKNSGRGITRRRGKLVSKPRSSLKNNAIANSLGNCGLCLVCGEKAGKHTYYGGRSCQSCRAFFRRSVETITKLVVISFMS